MCDGVTVLGEGEYAGLKDVIGMWMCRSERESA